MQSCEQVDQLRHSAGTNLEAAAGVVEQVHWTGVVGSAAVTWAGVHFMTGIAAAGAPVAAVVVVVITPLAIAMLFTYFVPAAGKSNPADALFVTFVARMPFEAAVSATASFAGAVWATASETRARTV